MQRSETWGLAGLRYMLGEEEKDMAERIGLGVVGLGSRWQRHESALGALGSDVRVRAVYDPLSIRAMQVAEQWRCEQVAGVIELIDRSNVDVVVVMGERLGLWPVERAILAGKPVYAAVSPLADPRRLEQLAQLVQIELKAPVHFSLWPALEFLTSLVEEQVVDSTGRIQQVQVLWVGGQGGDPLRSPAVLALIESCRNLIGGDLLGVRAVSPENRPEVVNVLLEFVGGLTAQLSLCQTGIGHPVCRVDVQGEHGTATLALPRRIRWRSATGSYSHAVPQAMAELTSLEGFFQALGEKEDFYDLKRALNALRWMQALWQSREEGTRVELP